MSVGKQNKNNVNVPFSTTNENSLKFSVSNYTVVIMFCQLLAPTLNPHGRKYIDNHNKAMRMFLSKTMKHLLVSAFQM